MDREGRRAEVQREELGQNPFHLRTLDAQNRAPVGEIGHGAGLVANGSNDIPCQSFIHPAYEKPAGGRC